MESLACLLVSENFHQMKLPVFSFEKSYRGGEVQTYSYQMGRDSISMLEAIQNMQQQNVEL
jgi:hypothetical protein